MIKAGKKNKSQCRTFSRHPQITCPTIDKSGRQGNGSMQRLVNKAKVNPNIPAPNPKHATISYSLLVFELVCLPIL